jgi:hypothetical protein
MHCAFCYLPTFGHAVSNESRKAPTSLVTHFVSASKNKKCERVNFTSKFKSSANKSRASTLRSKPWLEKQKSSSKAIKEYQNARIRKEAARTVSALPLMARRLKISSPSRGYQMQLNTTIPWQEVTVLSSWNRYACQLTANNSKPSYSQNWTRVNSGHICVSKQGKSRSKVPKLRITGSVVLEW